MIRGFEAVEERFQKHPELPTLLPTRGTRYSAGYDFYLKEDIEIPPHSMVKVYTDVKARMMPDEVLMLYVRSSIGIKKNLMLANTTGIIDADYFNNPDTGGNIILALYNYGDHTVALDAGERVMQGIFTKFLITINDKVLSEVRTGGVGSTNENT